METALSKAARLAGSQTGLAAKLGLTPQAIQQWIDQGRPPAKRCLAIEAAVGGAVTRYELRPDIFGPMPDNHLQGDLVGAITA